MATKNTEISRRLLSGVGKAKTNAEQGGAKDNISSVSERNRSIEQAQIFYLQLPASKERVKCSHMMLDPNLCFASTLNRRNQSLLSIQDPNLQALKQSFTSEGQRDPILVRPIDTKEGKRYEVVYGTRRRFVAELLNEDLKDQGGFPVRAWVSTRITDADAKLLATSENDDRQDISPWETAKYIEAVKLANPTWTQETIASMEGISQTSVNNFLILARLPESIIKLFESPSAVSITSGLKIYKIIEALGEKFEQNYPFLESQVPFASPDLLVNVMKEFLQRNETTHIPSRGKLQFSSKDGKTRAVITPHRTKQDSFVIRLDGVNQKLITKLEALLKAELK